MEFLLILKKTPWIPWKAIGSSQLLWNFSYFIEHAVIGAKAEGTVHSFHSHGKSAAPQNFSSPIIASRVHIYERTWGLCRTLRPAMPTAVSCGFPQHSTCLSNLLFISCLAIQRCHLTRQISCKWTTANCKTNLPGQWNVFGVELNICGSVHHAL